MKVNKEYKKINEVITQLENHKYSPLNASWCADRIVWAYKFKKITKEQMIDLSNRVTELFEMELI